MGILEIFEYSLEHVSADISRYVQEGVAGVVIASVVCREQKIKEELLIQEVVYTNGKGVVYDLAPHSSVVDVWRNYKVKLSCCLMNW